VHTPVSSRQFCSCAPFVSRQRGILAAVTAYRNLSFHRLRSHCPPRIYSFTGALLPAPTHPDLLLPSLHAMFKSCLFRQCRNHAHRIARHTSSTAILKQTGDSHRLITSRNKKKQRSAVRRVPHGPQSD